jgi:hypothetical protein
MLQLKATSYLNATLDQEGPAQALLVLRVPAVQVYVSYEGPCCSDVLGCGIWLCRHWLKVYKKFFSDRVAVDLGRVHESMVPPVVI